MYLRMRHEHRYAVEIAINDVRKKEKTLSFSARFFLGGFGLCFWLSVNIERLKHFSEKLQPNSARLMAMANAVDYHSVRRPTSQLLVVFSGISRYRFGLALAGATGLDLLRYV